MCTSSTSRPISVCSTCSGPAYAVEAVLIGDDRIPPLHEPLADLLPAPLTWVGAFDGAGGRTVLVSTGRDNTPARRLYEGYGFTWVNDAEVIPGLWVTSCRLTP
ncbi:hypothetical protein AB0C33_44875 [Nonomuraea sp. NPDC048881]|uniref:hypothetical protein n=1 Tax=Nonomuraea sp. NPDC048881 TaxID=3155030 RepID=UPI0033DB384A